MARDPAITFRGALQILGHYDRPWLDRLDRLLGGVILASGVVPASAVWGWVDQKNEAAGLLRRGLDAVSGRLAGAGGLGRHELVVAAHTTLVLAAFLETLRDRMGDRYDKAELERAHRVMLGLEEWQIAGEPLVRHLYTADVPSPSALRGFDENAGVVERWALERMASFGDLFFRVGFQRELMVGSFAQDVVDRYRSDYLRLATAVPEFRVWADLGEHAATRTALTKLEGMLSRSGSVPGDLRALLGEVNRDQLTRPVIDADIEGYGIDAVFPTVERIFLTPGFRSTTAHRGARIGDEHWWADVDRRQDLDVVLARHFSTTDCARLPLLLLGHPGAGKSLLTKVLAARLPAETYTVVRVPLRRVDADAHVSAQIQQALTLATNGRVLWPPLVNQSADAIRVILLDGLDELLQATTNDRAGYLTDIVEFQRIEAAMGKPVAVVVTSRTLVADRVRVPDGTPVLKLEEFDDGQIVEWLRVWNEVNSGVRPVRPEVVMAQGELARQPLLLLMLTLYFADPAVAQTEVGLSTVELYRRLFETYARREATKQAGRVLPDRELAEAVHNQLSRLSTAALGMVNRGRQAITEAELSADLAALGSPTPVGVRLLGEFFFVYAHEATAGEVLRGYEFLHATFAEYLVASRVVETLADVAEGAFGRRRFHDPDDELLFALLSHQPLAVQRPMLEFVADHLEAMNEADRADVCRTLELLIRDYRRPRASHRHLDYRPLPPDMVRALAAYSANLVLLRVLADPLGVELTALGDDPNSWPATVNLWAAGLDTEGYRAMLSAVTRFGANLILRGSSWRDVVEYNELNAAHLRGDTDTERRIRYGLAALHELANIDDDDPETWADSALSMLMSMAMGRPPGLFLADAPETVSSGTKSAVAELAFGVLGLHCVHWNRDEVERFLRWLKRFGKTDRSARRSLKLAESVHTGILPSLLDAPGEDWHALIVERSVGSAFQVVANYLHDVLPGRWVIPPYDGRS